MPIPPIEDHFQAQVIFSGVSGKAEDVFTNTWHFRNDNIVGDADEVADRLADHLAEFYTATPTNVAGGIALASRMSGQVIAGDIIVKVYDLGLPAPRFPLIRTRGNTVLGSTSLPSEVACCLSLVASQNTARNRGRIYLGPLTSNAGQFTNGAFRPATILIDSMLASLARLAGKAEHTPCVYSPTDGAMKPITGGWVDDAFDTQRRRGEDASMRHVWGNYLGIKGQPVALV